MFPLFKTWIEALESNKYFQCRGVYRKTSWAGENNEIQVNKYCAVGVLRNIMKDHSSDYDKIFEPKIDNPYYTLLGKTIRWNDGEKKTFGQIAQLIRNELETKKISEVCL